MVTNLEDYRNTTFTQNYFLLNCNYFYGRPFKPWEKNIKTPVEKIGIKRGYSISSFYDRLSATCLR